MLAGEIDRRFQHCQIGDRALGVGRRIEVGQCGAVENGGVNGAKVGLKAGLRAGRQQHDLGPRQGRGAHIDLIERVGHQHDGLGAGLCFGHGQQRRHEQRLAGARDQRDIVRRVDHPGR